MTDSRPIIWSIAGSDSGGGAGIQADILTINALGGHACTLITTLTAQNSVGVQSVTAVDAPMFQAQADSLAADLPPAAIKIGLIAAPWQIRLLREWLRRWKTQWPDVPVVLDPVLVATSGDALSSAGTLQDLLRLLPEVDVLTPNLPELEALTASVVHSPKDAERAARSLLKTGCRAVLVKGGHGYTDDPKSPHSIDLLVSTDAVWRFTQPRIATKHTHGTGCTLSSAIATHLARGLSVPDACALTSAYVQQGLLQAYSTGSGAGTLERRQSTADWLQLARLPACDLPLTDRPAPEAFLPCTSTPHGIYPVVPDTHWLQRLLKAGAQVIQLRIKENDPERLLAEIRTAVQLGQQYGAQVFINDHWQLALELGAYGVHLGQEDLADADLAALRQAGVRLGVSTHGYAELLRAIALRPSYVALGHIFPTQTKQMPSQPQGLARLARYQALADEAGLPTVAIGGIKPHHLSDLRACGVRCVAVVTALTESDNPEQDLAEMNQALEAFND
ncbi:MAG: thiamine phosphate synthase [Natronospirillum sp.]